MRNFKAIYIELLSCPSAVVFRYSFSCYALVFINKNDTHSYISRDEIYYTSDAAYQYRPKAWCTNLIRLKHLDRSPTFCARNLGFVNYINWCVSSTKLAVKLYGAELMSLHIIIVKRQTG